MMNDQMMEVTRMFRDSTGSDVIFGPDPDDAWSLVPFPVIATLLHRVDDVLIEQRLERFREIARHVSDLRGVAESAASHLNNFQSL